MARKEKKSGKEMETGSAARMPASMEEMSRWMDNFFREDWLRPWRMDWPAWGELPFGGRIPRVDVVDRDNEVVVRAEIPGVSKEDLEISATDSSVTIKGKTRHEEKEEKGDYFHSEISTGSFLRTVALPAFVDADKVKSKFSDGVLELTLPKVEKTKRRSVKID
jgi:HSP20 family protein